MISAIIPAAGLGKRLGLGLPKALAPVNGVPLVIRQVEQLLTHGVTDIRVVIGYQAEAVKKTLDGYAVSLFHNEDFASTNVAYSVSCAIETKHLDYGNFLFLDGDVLLADSSLRMLITAGKQVVGLSHKPNSVYASCSDELVVKALSREIKSEYSWACCGVFNYRLFTEAEENSYVFEQIAEALPLPGLVVDMAEIDTQEDLRNAEQWLNQKK